jgi:hypothetical protein
LLFTDVTQLMPAAHQQAKVLCWRGRYGHKLCCFFPGALAPLQGSPVALCAFALLLPLLVPPLLMRSGHKLLADAKSKGCLPCCPCALAPPHASLLMRTGHKLRCIAKSKGCFGVGLYLEAKEKLERLREKVVPVAPLQGSPVAPPCACACIAKSKGCL